jgi:hypothetical protein
MVEELTSEPSRRETWIRALYVILFALIYSVAEIVIIAVVVLQFGFVLISGDRNQKLLDFGASLSKFIYQILQYVTFNSEDKPFPFSDWPSGNGDVETDAPAGST